MPDYLLAAIIAMVSLLAIAYVTTHYRNKIQSIITKHSLEIKELEKRPIPSQELREFFRDIDVKGYSLVRIDPDDVFYSSPRGRN